MIIRFPNLHFYIEGVPRAYRILGVEFTMFGTMIAIGMLFGLFVVWIQAGRQGKNTNRLLGAAIVASVGGIIGARIFYVAVNWQLYKGDLVEILRIREGGLAVYGAILGGIVLVFCYCLITGDSYLQTVDVLALGACMTQVIGRWGDYFNRCSFGEYTNWLWAMQLPIADVRSEEVTELMRENLVEAGGVTYVQVTPVFFLESLLCLILLLWMFYSSRHRAFDGQVYLQYMAGYGAIRFVCEWLRTDKLMIPGLNISISLVLSLVFVAYFGLQGVIRSSLARKRAEVRREAQERYEREGGYAPEVRGNIRDHAQNDHHDTDLSGEQKKREDDSHNSDAEEESSLLTDRTQVQSPDAQDKEEGFAERIEKRRENYRSDISEAEKEEIRGRIQEEREAAYKKELEEKLQNRKELRRDASDPDKP